MVPTVDFRIDMFPLISSLWEAALCCLSFFSLQQIIQETFLFNLLGELLMRMASGNGLYLLFFFFSQEMASWFVPVTWRWEAARHLTRWTRSCCFRQNCTAVAAQFWSVTPSSSCPPVCVLWFWLLFLILLMLGDWSIPHLHVHPGVLSNAHHEHQHFEDQPRWDDGPVPLQKVKLSSLSWAYTFKMAMAQPVLQILKQIWCGGNWVTPAPLPEDSVDFKEIFRKWIRFSSATDKFWS